MIIASPRNVVALFAENVAVMVVVVMVAMMIVVVIVVMRIITVFVGYEFLLQTIRESGCSRNEILVSDWVECSIYAIW